jgi:hypothetical protein
MDHLDSDTEPKLLKKCDFIKVLRDGEANLDLVEKYVPCEFDISDEIWQYPIFHLDSDVLEYLTELYPPNNLSENMFWNFIETHAYQKTWDELCDLINKFDRTLTQIKWTSIWNYVNSEYVSTAVFLIDACLRKVGPDFDLIGAWIGVINNTRDLDRITYFEQLFEPFAAKGLVLTVENMKPCNFESICCEDVRVSFLCAQMGPDGVAELLANYTSNNEHVDGFYVYNTIKIIAQYGVDFSVAFK